MSTYALVRVDRKYNPDTNENEYVYTPVENDVQAVALGTVIEDFANHHGDFNALADFIVGRVHRYLQYEIFKGLMILIGIWSDKYIKDRAAYFDGRNLSVGKACADIVTNSASDFIYCFFPYFQKGK